MDGFLARNREALRALSLEPRIVSGRDGIRLELQPGLRAGAIPLRSAVTGLVAGGIVVNPRFGWPGVGQVLSATGWGSGPEFLSLPLVPGSGREVPAWVLAGPVLRRLKELLANLRPGYVERNEVRSHPRGQIQWQTYLTRQLPSGRWHHLPCRFSEIDTDSRLRQAVRWTLERLHFDLGAVGGGDQIALSLIGQIILLLEQVIDVPARRPLRGELERDMGGGSMTSLALLEGLRAMSWIVDERGLGGGRTSDGLAWTLPLEQLWERYVESLLRAEAGRTGGRVRVGRSGETVVPLAWDDPSHRALGHLVPDFVVHRPDGIEIVDAKYKSHFADLDANRWSALAEETQASMRADLHQVLAYAATAGSSDKIRATLIYPVRRNLYEDLEQRDRAETKALISVGSRQITLSMKAVPFGLA
ncbi:MAG: hypothetical protein IPH41_06950 [Sulfuritalea sp.]|nr:hypothetical protein [Sulfuritalea sp.]